MDLCGVHFSSAKPPNPSWMAWGSERAGRLVVEGIEPVGATFAEVVSRTLPHVLGIDTPFGVPFRLARALVPLVTNGSQILEHLTVGTPAELDAAWARFATERPGALRLTDALTNGAPSITAPRPPLWRSLRGLARILWSLRDRVAIVPFDTLELVPTRPMVLEVLPGSLLRILGLPFEYRPAPDLRGDPNAATRLAVLSQLSEGVASFGLPVEVAASVANACAGDPNGDALDAVLACVTVHLATRGQWAPPPLTGYGASRSLVEGWIARPA